MTFVKAWAFKPRTVELLEASNVKKSDRWMHCPTCGRGVPIGRRCHGWHLTLQRPSDRRVRLLSADQA